MPNSNTPALEPGIVLDELRKAAGAYGLTFGPDPATHSRNTLGGMIGNNSCGIHSVMAGETVDNIDELDVALYDGTHLTVTSPATRITSASFARVDVKVRSIVSLRRCETNTRHKFANNFP